MRSKFSKMRSIFSKTRTKLSKTEVKTQSNGRVNPPNLNKPVWDPKYGCVLLPLGSPTSVSKRPYVHVPVVSSTAQQRRWARVRRSGHGWDGYSRVGTGGVIPTHRPSCSRRTHEQALTAKRAPEPPAGGWSGWSGCSGVRTPSVRCARTTLRARSVPVGPPCPGSA